MIQRDLWSLPKRDRSPSKLHHIIDLKSAMTNTVRLQGDQNGEEESVEIDSKLE